MKTFMLLLFIYIQFVNKASFSGLNFNHNIRGRTKIKAKSTIIQIFTIYNYSFYSETSVLETQIKSVTIWKKKKKVQVKIHCTSVTPAFKQFVIF